MNMQNLMSQMQKMQKDIQKKQNEVEQMEFEGNSEWVKIILNGKREVISVKIDYKDLQSDDLEMLEDMIKIAFSNALEKIDSEYEKKLGAYSKYANGLM